MLRSTYCVLSELGDKDLTDLLECPYDEVCIIVGPQGLDDMPCLSRWPRVVILSLMARKRC